MAIVYHRPRRRPAERGERRARVDNHYACARDNDCTRGSTAGSVHLPVSRWRVTTNALRRISQRGRQGCISQTLGGRENRTMEAHSQKEEVLQKEEEEAAAKGRRNVMMQEEIYAALMYTYDLGDEELIELITGHQVAEDENTDIAYQIAAAEFRIKEKLAQRVLAELMDAKRAGQLPGVYGRLGDLGEIPEKYDVAVSSCCELLDSVVVDNMDTGAACVKHLRARGTGRGTLIPLHLQANKPPPTTPRTFPENLPRLYDLITCADELVKSAFYAALNDTLVAETLEQATRIAHGDPPYRVVTLTGDVLPLAVQRNTLVAEILEQATHVPHGDPPYRVVTLAGDVVEKDDGTFTFDPAPVRRRGRMRTRPPAPAPQLADEEG